MRHWQHGLPDCDRTSQHDQGNRTMPTAAEVPAEVEYVLRGEGVASFEEAM